MRDAPTGAQGLPSAASWPPPPRPARVVPRPPTPGHPGFEGPPRLQRRCAATPAARRSARSPARGPDPAPPPSARRRPRAGERGSPGAAHPHSGGQRVAAATARKGQGCSATGRTVPDSPLPPPWWLPTQPPLVSAPPGGLRSPDGFREEEAAATPWTLHTRPRL